MSLRGLLRKITHRPIRTPEEFWRKHASIGEINEFFKRQVISSDDRSYTLPFMCNPFRWKEEARNWQETDSLNYEYLEDAARGEADQRFDSFWPLIENRLEKDWVIYDVGCNTGYFLEKLREKGFSRLHGIDPQTVAVQYANRTRPHLGIREGFFGPPEGDMECDVLIMFKSIFRIPYRSGLFEAMDRCAKKYIALEGVPEMTTFCRDVHAGLAKKGFICIDKRVTDLDSVPIGHPGADNTLVALNPPPGMAARKSPLFLSNFVFRRIEPRD